MSGESDARHRRLFALAREMIKLLEAITLHPPESPMLVTDDQMYLSTRQVGELLGVSARTIDRWRVAGEGPPFIRLGRRVLYKTSDVHAWAATCTRLRDDPAG